MELLDTSLATGSICTSPTFHLLPSQRTSWYEIRGSKSASPGSVRSPRTTITCLGFVSTSHSARTAGPQERWTDERSVWLSDSLPCYLESWADAERKPAASLSTQSTTARSIVGREEQGTMRGCSDVCKGFRSLSTLEQTGEQRPPQPLTKFGREAPPNLSCLCKSNLTLS